MFIKKLENADIENISEIEKICFPDTFWTMEQIQSHLKNFYGMGMFNQSIIGYILFSETISEIEILRIGVLPDERRKGLAEKLIYEIKDRKKDLILEVSDTNDFALKLYQKCGFKTIHSRKKYYRDESNALILKYTVI
ncbi:MAG: ribosomal protein S18-alanine N-acetyltransferase [Leptospiraceae bacterium]|nr:ribosomal protein S18-alanine N-acetyltransferase [Leptospiraceae bacterium]MCK6381143.1 ribosomal protein S18-alanine N-acetyltransferase [Leptospiraceae bacterium]NUM40567.1 ribosomal protein S18-alanine N-acetyltransferase [Leptospiraceae bacterium]